MWHKWNHDIFSILYVPVCMQAWAELCVGIFIEAGELEGGWSWTVVFLTWLLFYWEWRTTNLLTLTWSQKCTSNYCSLPFAASATIFKSFSFFTKEHKNKFCIINRKDHQLVILNQCVMLQRSPNDVVFLDLHFRQPSTVVSFLANL